MLIHCRGLLAAVFCIAILTAPAARAAETTLSFHPHTGFVDARLAGNAGATLALAGRDDLGRPQLALLRYRDGALERREIALPVNAVAIDAGPSGDGAESIFVLCADRVLRIDAFDGQPVGVAEAPGIFRGRSYAELTSAIDFARDLDGDGVAELLVQDFDVLRVFGGAGYASVSVLALPSIRRGFDNASSYRPVRIAAANVDGARALLSVRGNTLMRFDWDGDGYRPQPVVDTLSIGLSDEYAIEAFYNGYENIDQSEVVLREPELLRDVNGDGMADLVTLETRSTGVFDKESTYRVHLARAQPDGVGFETEPDTVLSSKGYQFGLRAEPVDGERVALISPGVQIGLRAIIGALFTKSVTLEIAIHAPDADGVIPVEPNTVVRTKISFDFGSGRAELPTIAFGDFDGDGRNDLLLKRRGSDVEWRRNIGDGQFASDARELEIVGPTDGTGLVAIDLDGDNRSEVIARYAVADGEGMDRVVRVHRVAVPAD